MNNNEIKKEFIIKKVKSNKLFNKDDIIYLLKLLRTDEKEWIYALADKVRQQHMGDTVYIRGIVEFSNNCWRTCNYCGIRNLNPKVERYSMHEEEILGICKKMKQYGQTTVVLQSGEDLSYTKKRIGDLIKQIKKETELAVTLSVGERDESTYQYWKECGLDRYLLRFETSNEKIFKKLHQDDDFHERINCVKILKRIGVQTGSGFMIDLPKATDNDITNDILLCHKLDLDMIGIGPFIPHPDTPLAKLEQNHSIDFITGVLSILRLVNKDAHIPATTAYDAIHSNGRQLALQRGANVFMPNSTPAKYRSNYLLYPNKPCVDESSDKCSQCVIERIKSLGRKIGTGPGHSIHKSVYS